MDEMIAKKQEPDRRLWKRLIAKRCIEFGKLNETIRTQILEDAWTRHPFPSTIQNNDLISKMNESQRIERLLQDHLIVCSIDYDVSVNKRRSSLNALNDLLSTIHKQKLKSRKEVESTNSIECGSVEVVQNSHVDDNTDSRRNSSLNCVSKISPESKSLPDVAMSCPPRDDDMEIRRLENNSSKTDVDVAEIIDNFSKNVVQEREQRLHFSFEESRQPINEQQQQNIRQQQQQQQAYHYRQQHSFQRPPQQQNQVYQQTDYSQQQEKLKKIRMPVYTEVIRQFGQRDYFQFQCHLCRVQFEGTKTFLIDHCNSRIHQQYLYHIETTGGQYYNNRRHHDNNFQQHTTFPPCHNPMMNYSHMQPHWQQPRQEYFDNMHNVPHAPYYWR